MSDTTDDIEALAGVYEAQRESWEEMMEGDFWRTKTGQVLKIEDMKTSHIQNCIAMLERELKDDPGDQFYMGDSDFAEDAVESENRHNEWLRELFSGKIKQFKRELKLRGVGNNTPIRITKKY